MAMSAAHDDVGARLRGRPRGSRAEAGSATCSGAKIRPRAGSAAPSRAGSIDTAGLSAAAYLFHGLGDRSRLSIVRHLALGEHRVVDLTRHLGLAQSTVSKHLSSLLACGVVSVRAEGRASVYSLAHPETTMELLAVAEKLLGATDPVAVTEERR